MHNIRTTLLTALTFAMCAQGQTFEAAAIKAIPESVDFPPRAGYWFLPRMDDPVRFHARIQVERLVEWAYGLRAFQIVGGPAWIRDGRARFDVQATASRSSTTAEMRKMLQALLAERFKLKVRREAREVPIYALVIGKNGPKLAAAKDEHLGEGRGNIDVGQGLVRGRGVTIPKFVEILSENLERPVIDKTGLTGHYDFDLRYDATLLTDWSLSPVLFSLVQDAGLKLEPQKGQFEILVIDSVELPTEN